MDAMSPHPAVIDLRERVAERLAEKARAQAKIVTFVETLESGLIHVAVGPISGAYGREIAIRTVCGRLLKDFMPVGPHHPPTCARCVCRAWTAENGTLR